MPSTRMRAALLGVLLAVGGLSRGTALADVAPSVIIVPGQSIGPVRLGMSVADVRSVLGNPVPAEGGQVRFPRVAVTVTFQDGAVVQVSTTNPQFRTVRGAGVGIRLDDSAHLVGDSNQTLTVAGSDTTVVYPFQGIGFVFRDERAVEVFVVQSIAATLSPSLPPSAAIPALPPGEDVAQTAPAAQAAPPAQTAPSSGPTLVAQDIAETVDASQGILRITGRLVNTGQQAVGPVTVFARLTTAGAAAGGESRAEASAPLTIAPGDAGAFRIDAPVVQAVVTQYTAVALVGGAAGAGRGLVVAQRTIPRAAYVDLARERVQVSVQIGAPSNSAPRVQILVSIAGTGPIPRDWVREVQVEIPFTGGTSTVTLTPGQEQTILIPSVAQIGQPQVQRVVLNAS